MAIPWHTNAYNLGKDLLFVLLWIASWSLVEMAVEHLSYHRQRRKVMMYAGLFVATFMVLLFVGSGYE